MDGTSTRNPCSIMPSKIAESLISGIRNVSRRRESEILEVGISKSAKEGNVQLGYVSRSRNIKLRCRESTWNAPYCLRVCRGSTNKEDTSLVRRKLLPR